LSKPSLENEILTLKSDIFLKTRAGQESFWKLVPRHKFPDLRRCSEIVHSCFGSTYLCESAFSYLKMTKSKQRSNMYFQCMLLLQQTSCVVLFLPIFLFKARYDDRRGW
jgi:hypothetical protein